MPTLDVRERGDERHEEPGRLRLPVIADPRVALVHRLGRDSWLTRMQEHTVDCAQSVHDVLAGAAGRLRRSLNTSRDAIAAIP